MSNGLVVTGQPRNLRYVRGHVEGDVYNICGRLAEIDKDLFVNPIDPPRVVGDNTYNWAIVEECADGVDRLVFYTSELDARILEHVRYIMSVPFEQRFAEAERRADASEAAAREHEKDELVETMGLPMLKQLEHDGFLTHRGTSYAKRGIHFK